MQSWLSFIRAVAAVSITVLEGKMLADASGVELTRVLWKVGNGGDDGQGCVPIGTNSLARSADNDLSKKLAVDDYDLSVMMLEINSGGGATELQQSVTSDGLFQVDEPGTSILDETTVVERSLILVCGHLATPHLSF